MKESRPKPKLPEGFIVTIDGTAASGKGTTAAMVAKHLGLVHIDSGSIYRAVALLALEREIAAEQEQEIVDLLAHVTPELLVDERIRSDKVSAHSSNIAKIMLLRAGVKGRSREMVQSHAPGAVVEGRDSATVFPQAHAKFFITASPEARATRRHKQSIQRGEGKAFEELLEAIKKRDEQDTTRTIDPLVVPEDALHIDNTHLSREEVFDLVVDHIYKKHGSN